MKASGLWPEGTVAIRIKRMLVVMFGGQISTFQPSILGLSIYTPVAVRFLIFGILHSGADI